MLEEDLKQHPERSIHELMSLKGLVAIVTGAAGWLGSPMSRALAEAGATVVVTSRTADKAEEFAATLPGSGHVGLPLSQDDTNSLEPFVQEVVRRVGRVDVLVNNAYGGTAPKIDTATADDFDRAFHTGVTSYFLLARSVAHHLRERQAPGSIINIASMYGVVASYPKAYEGLKANSPPNYHALKGGLVHLTRHLAAYWAPYNCPFAEIKMTFLNFRPIWCKHPATVPKAPRCGFASRLKVECGGWFAQEDAR